MVAQVQRRRQWGSDRRWRAMPIVSPPVSDRRLAVGRLAIVVTLVAWVAYFLTWLFDDLLNSGLSSAVDRTESISYLLVVTLLTASALAYLLSRLGFFYRARQHHRAARRELDEFFSKRTPTLTAIVPSYQEDARVIRNTLLSVTLQEYPDKRVVLLIDDPPEPRNRHAQELLLAARALPGEIEALLSEPAVRFTQALEAFEAASLRGAVLEGSVMTTLAEHYEAGAAWLRRLAEGHDMVDHTDEFLVNEVLLRLAGEFETIADALKAALSEEVVLPEARIRQLYRRLAWTFRVEVTSFERKKYISLSHEANKASNLNSYIGLMGGSFQVVRTPAGLALAPASPGTSELTVPDPDYVLTLDADSILLPEYCLRLVHVLEQSEYQDVAIAQTPYSAFPGSATRLERIAGATTDLQHIVHQGLTYYDATFWVGANAVIRKRALDAIAEKSYIGDWEVRKYIRDRTVIEDTESTIDLGIHGWKLFNYPERLSYSATPPDFGALCIQRRRWANGGLLILPKLHRQSRLRRKRGERTRFGELFLRWNYMASICWSSVSLVVLLAFPFDATLINPLLGLIALPYFAAMASDLHYCGYKRSDVARIYGFNLVLVPVNLAGTVSSLIQGLTSSKSAFARTPKVRDRTVTPAFFLVAPYLLVMLAGYTFFVSYQHSLEEDMGYAALNVVLAIYAVVAYIGLRNSFVDGWIHFKSLLYKRSPVRKKNKKNEVAAHQLALSSASGGGDSLDWQSVLQVGPAYARRWSNPTGLALLRRGPAEWKLADLSMSSEDHIDTQNGSLESFRALPDVQFPRTETHASSALEFRTVYQPLIDLTSDRVVGFEALSRFDDGVSVEEKLLRLSAPSQAALEGALVRAALESAAMLPKGRWLAVKASFQLMREDVALSDVLSRAERPILVESQLPTMAQIAEALLVAGSLPPNVRLALERVGADDWSQAVVATLRPAIVKLATSTVVGLASDQTRQAQVQGMVAIVRAHGGEVVAVGIEQLKDCDVARALGVRFAQGFLFGRPKEFVDA